MNNSLVPSSEQYWLLLPKPHDDLTTTQRYVIESVVTCQLVLVYISTSHLLDKAARILTCVAVGMSAAAGTLFAVYVQQSNNNRPIIIIIITQRNLTPQPDMIFYVIGIDSQSLNRLTDADKNE